MYSTIPLNVYRLFPSQRPNPAAISRQKSYPLFCASRMLFTGLVSSLSFKLSDFCGNVSNLCTTLTALMYSSIFRIASLSGDDDSCQKIGMTINPTQMPITKENTFPRESPAIFRSVYSTLYHCTMWIFD